MTIQQINRDIKALSEETQKLIKQELSKTSHTLELQIDTYGNTAFFTRSGMVQFQSGGTTYELDQLNICEQITVLENLIKLKL